MLDQSCNRCDAKDESCGLCKCYEEGFDAGANEVTDFIETDETTYDEAYDDGYQAALADIHAAISYNDGIGSNQDALQIIEEAMNG